MNIHREELAWAAGFYDGEGCTSQSEGRPCIAVSQAASREELDRFNRAINNQAYVLGPYGPYQPNHKPIYRLQATGLKRVEAIIGLLWPFLCSIKKKQASKIMQDYRDKVKARIKTHCPQGHPYSGDNLYVHKKTGYRQCKTCSRKNNRNWYAKRRNTSSKS